MHFSSQLAHKVTILGHKELRVPFAQVVAALYPSQEDAA